MAHFTQLDENNIVLNVIVVANEELLDENGVEQETLGVEFCKSLFGNDTNWKQTSYNGNFRKHYASIGFTYDESADVFYEPQPFASWTLNTETYKWDPPLPKPEVPEGSEGFYGWNEEAHQADNTVGWEFVDLKYISLNNLVLFDNN